MSRAEDLSALAAGAGTIAFAEAVTRLAQRLGAPSPVGAGGKAADEKILFRAQPSLGFPPSDVAAIRFPAEAKAASWPAAEMEVTFLGLYGPASPLPPAWTERIVMEEEGAENLRDLLDLFGHPLVALAFRIWRHHRLDLRFDPRATDPGSRAALALAGVVVEEGARDPDLDPMRLLPLSGLLAQHARSAEVLRRAIAEYFAIPAAIEEWVPRMAPIPEDQQFRLGDPALSLGHSTVLGEAVPDVAGAVTIVLGPLSLPAFEAFLPGGAARRSLAALLRLVVREPLAFSVDLVLEKDAPAGFALGDGRLGWTTFQEAPDTLRRCPTGPA